MRRPRSEPGAVRARACAKVNLMLQVIGRRADGYHELRTIFQSLALHDTLTFTSTGGAFEIDCADPHCPRDRSNLVWKASEQLWRHARFRGELSGVRVHIRKRIPVQAGLGGGSSDAAAALRALSELWKLPLDEESLRDLASGLGADVPFFLRGGTALGLDRGDVLFSLPDESPAWVVIARPDFGVSTRDAFGWWDDGVHASVDSGGRGRESGPANDLQGPVVARYPAIDALIKQLERYRPRCAAMSGSGSAVFGLFDDSKTATLASAKLAKSGVHTWITRTLKARQYRSAVRPVLV